MSMREVGLSGLAMMLAATWLTGCTSGPQFGPYDDGIPSARASAAAELEAYVDKVQFSDQVTVMAEGRADACDTTTDGTVFEKTTGYYCVMGWMAVVTLSPSVTREEFAAKVDSEMQAMDVGYVPWSLVSSLALNYPSNRDWAPLSGGGHTGDVTLTVESTPFPGGPWLTPRIPRGINEVSASGNLDTVTPDAVAATGANEVVTVLAKVTYWDSYALTQPETQTANSIASATFDEGNRYRFDIIGPLPEDGIDACVADPVVDPATVLRADAPFPRIGFELGEDTPGDDVARVRKCLDTSLDSGTVIVYSPVDPN